MRYILDASVAVRWFVEDFAHPNADAVLEKMVHQPELFSVPKLFLNEVYSVLQRHHPDAVTEGSNAVVPEKSAQAGAGAMETSVSSNQRPLCLLWYYWKLSQTE